MLQTKLRTHTHQSSLMKQLTLSLLCISVALTSPLVDLAHAKKVNWKTEARNYEQAMKNVSQVANMSIKSEKDAQKAVSLLEKTQGLRSDAARISMMVQMADSNASFKRQVQSALAKRCDQYKDLAQILSCGTSFLKDLQANPNKSGVQEVVKDIEKRLKNDQQLLKKVGSKLDAASKSLRKTGASKQKSQVDEWLFELKNMTAALDEELKMEEWQVPEITLPFSASSTGLTLNGRKPPIFHSLSRIFPTYMKVKRKSWSINLVSSAYAQGSEEDDPAVKAAQAFAVVLGITTTAVCTLGGTVSGGTGAIACAVGAAVIVGTAITVIYIETRVRKFTGKGLVQLGSELINCLFTGDCQDTVEIGSTPGEKCLDGADKRRIDCLDTATFVWEVPACWARYTGETLACILL